MSKILKNAQKNFSPVHRTYDQDQDADLWREKIIIGRPTSRYLCISKTEGLPEYVLETLKIISEKDSPPQEFSLLSRTADTEQKAWRKKQIAYKLSKRGNVTNAITDIILCSKLKSAPEGFKFAGEINGILICYKTGAIPIRLPPPIPQSGGAISSMVSYSNDNFIKNKNSTSTNEIEKALNRININKQNHALPSNPNDHDYEEIQASYQLSPKRPAPKPPVTSSIVGTLGAYSEIEGVPFIFNGKLAKGSKWCENLIKDINNKSNNGRTTTASDDYDFQLERQILCTMKSSSSTNPFFK